MAKSKKMNKFIAMLLSVAMIMTSGTFSFASTPSNSDSGQSSVNINTTGDRVGSVEISIEDSVPVPEGEEWPAPKGEILSIREVPLFENDSMMSVVERTCNDYDIPIALNSDKTYIEGIANLFEKDKGPGSGWMASLNDWFTDTGIANYTYKDGTLSNGDRIELKYTQNLGKDLGNDFDGKDNRLTSLTIEGGTLDKDFNPDEYSYTIKDAGNTVKLSTVAVNKKFKVEHFLNGEKINKYDHISVKNEDIITVKCGLKENWKEYTFKIQSKSTVDPEPTPVPQEKVNVTINRAFALSPSREDGDTAIVNVETGERVVDLIHKQYDTKTVYPYDNEHRFAQWNISLIPGRYRMISLSTDSFGSSVPWEINPEGGAEFIVEPDKENQVFNFIALNVTKGFFERDSVGKLINMGMSEEEIYREFDVTCDIEVRDKNGKVVIPNREDSHNLQYFLVDSGNGFEYKLTVRVRDRRLQISDLIKSESLRKEFNKSRTMMTAEIDLYDGSNKSGKASYDCRTQLPSEPYKIVVPKDLENFEIYAKNTKAYEPLIPLTSQSGVTEPVRTEYAEDPRFDVYTFECLKPQDAIIRGGGEYKDKDGNVKKSKYIKSEYQVQLNPLNEVLYFMPSKVGSGGKNNFEYNDHAAFLPASYPYNDILTNLKDEGMYQIIDSGETVELNTFRTEQGVRGVTSNTIFEPDKQYQIYGDTVELSETKGAEGNKWVEVTGKKDGASIVAIAYEPVEELYIKNDENGNKVADNKGEYGPAIDPENIGIAIYDVNGRGDTIDPGIDLLKYDTIYFNKSVTGPSGENLGGQESKAYTFTPKSKAGIKSVEYHTPIASMDDFNNEHFFDDNTWKKAKADGDKYTVQLGTGRNIIKITANDGAVRYFTIMAKGIDVTAEKIEGTEGPLKKGDTLRVSFSDLELPVPKLSAIYNPGFPDRTFLIGNANGKPIEGPHTQYVLFAFNYFDIEIDDEESIDLSDIRIHADHMGSALDSHCEVDKNGLPPDFNAENKGGIYCYFDDISIPVEGNKGQEVTSKYHDKYNETAAEYVKHNLKFGTEWPVIGLARGGYDVDKSFYDNYYNDVVKTVKEKKGELSTRKYTEYSRTILALTAAGYDPTDVGGYNLVDKLGEFDNVKAQGLNGPIWALIALNSHEFDSEADTKANTDKLLETVLAGEVKGGGWTLMEGDPADIDMTAMAIQSLAPYYDSNEKVKAAVDRGLDFLSKKQDKNGGYMNAYEETSSESISQVIVALTSLGIDPQKDERFIKNGNNMLDALCDFYAGNGMFKHTLDGKADGMATEQAFYALASYIRFEKDMTSLYDMSDVKFTDEPIVTPDVPDTPDTPVTPVKPSVDDKGNGTISSETASVNVKPSELKNLKNKLDVILSGNAKITYDEKALEEIKKQLPDDAVNIEFVLEKTEKGVNDKQKATIDASKALEVFRIEIIVTRADGSRFRIHDFGEGRVNVSIAFANPENLKLEVHRVENDGKITLMNSTYSEGILSWVTDGHSYYMVTEEGTAKVATDKTTPKTGDTDNMMLWLIVLMGAAGTVALIKRKKER